MGGKKRPDPPRKKGKKGISAWGGIPKRGVAPAMKRFFINWGRGKEKEPILRKRGKDPPAHKRGGRKLYEKNGVGKLGGGGGWGVMSTGKKRPKNFPDEEGQTAFIQFKKETRFQGGLKK